MSLNGGAAVPAAAAANARRAGDPVAEEQRRVEFGQLEQPQHPCSYVAHDERAAAGQALVVRLRQVEQTRAVEESESGQVQADEPAAGEEVASDRGGQHRRGSQVQFARHSQVGTVAVDEHGSDVQSAECSDRLEAVA